ncbi:MAG TPA: aminoacyl-tRNA hydrolase [bacterium]
MIPRNCYSLLVGLGNPGIAYKGTRHNLGFSVVDALAGELGVRLNYEKENVYIIGQGCCNGRPVILAKPQTYMNRSGTAVNELLHMFDTTLADLLVIVDDFNLAFGKLRFRSKGSDGGHNGLASIIATVGSTDFPRLRIGIGRESIADPVHFVLSKFDEAERKELNDVIDKCVQACRSFVVEGINIAMNRFN